MAFTITDLTGNSNTAGATVAVTIGAGGVPKGATIIVVVADASTAGTAGTIADSKSNSWSNTVAALGFNAAAGTNGYGRIFHCLSVTTALVNGDTITFTKNTSGKAGAISAFFVDPTTGNPGLNSQDGAVTASATGSSTAPSVTSGTPAVSGELFIGAVAGKSFTAYTNDSGHSWTSPPFTFEHSTNVSTAGSEQTNAGTGTKIFAPTLTTTGTWAAWVVGFKAATVNTKTVSPTNANTLSVLCNKLSSNIVAISSANSLSAIRSIIKAISSLNSQSVAVLKKLSKLINLNGTIWNPNDFSSGGNLTNNDLTLEAGNNTSFYYSARANVSIKSGEFKYFEVFVERMGMSDDSGVGIANAVFGLGPNTTNYVGFDGSSAGAFSTDGTGTGDHNWYINNSPSTLTPYWATGQTLGIAVDGQNKVIWLTNDGTTWNSGGSSGPGNIPSGKDISAITFPVFPAITVTGGGTKGKMTANFGPVFLYGLPNGYSAVTTSTQLLSVVTSKIRSLVISVSETQVLVLVLVRQIGRSVALLSGESLQVLKSVGRIVNLLSSNVLNLVRSTGHLISISSTNGVLTLLKQVGKRINTSLANVLAVTETKSGNSINVSITSTSSMSLQRQIYHLISLVSAEVVSVVRQIARSIGLATPNTLSLRRAIGKIINLTSAYALAVIRKIGHIIGRAVTNVLNLDAHKAGTITNLTINLSTFPDYLNPTNSDPALIFSNGNLTITAPGSGTTYLAYDLVGLPATGKFFFSGVGANGGSIPGALCLGIATLGGNNLGFVGYDAYSLGFVSQGGYVFNNSNLVVSGYGVFGDGAVVDVAVDNTAQLIWWRFNGGNWNNDPTADPATGTNGLSFAALIFPSGPATVYAAFSVYYFSGGPSTSSWVTNFSGPFTYAPPSGFSLLSTSKQPNSLSLATKYLKGVLVSLSEANSLSVRRQIARFVLLSSSQVLTVARQISRVVGIASTNVSSLARSVGRTINLFSSNVSSLLRSNSRTISSSTLNTLTLSRSISHALNMANVNVLALLKQVGKLLGMANASVVSVAKLRTVYVTIALLTANVLTVPRQVAHALSMANANVLSAAKQIAKPLAMANANTLTLLRSMARAINLASANTLSLLRSIGRSSSLTTPNTLLLSRQIAHAVSLTTSYSLLLGRAMARTISLATPNVLTVLRSKTINQLAAMTSANVLNLSRQIGHSVSLTAAYSLSLLRGISHTINLTSAQTIRVARASAHIVSLTTANTLSLSRQIAHLFGMTNANVLTVGRFIGSTIHIASSNVLHAARQLFRTINLSTPDVLSLARAIGLTHILNINLVTTNLLTLQRQISHTVNVTLTNTVSVTRASGHLVQASFSNSLSAARSIGHGAGAVLSNILSLSRWRTLGQPINVTTIYSLSLAKQISHIVGVALANSASVTKTVLTRLSMTNASVVSATSGISRVISTVTANSLTAATQIGALFLLTTTEVVSVSKRISATIRMATANTLSALAVALRVNPEYIVRMSKRLRTASETGRARLVNAVRRLRTMDF